MGDRILVPIDGSDRSLEALRYALSTHPDSEITVIHVLDPSDLHHTGVMNASVMTDLNRVQREGEEAAEELFDTARNVAAERGNEIATAFRTGKASRTITEYANDTDIDHIVIGSHGRSGMSRVLVGSVAETVVRRSSVPVTIVR